MEQKTIVLTGGGTAGHVMPHLAILPLLSRSFSNVQYIGSENGIERSLMEERRIPYHAVTTVKLRRTLTPENLKIPFLLSRGVREAKAALSRIKPDVVFSKGGFVAVPVVRAAAKLGIPVVIHESDYTPGLANRLCASRAEAVCTSFADTAARFHEKGVYTGTPIRPELAGGSRQRGLARLGFSSAKPVLLVMGGSSGSASINAAVRAALPALTQRYFVLHITGKGNCEQALESAHYRQLAFTTDLADYFAAADLVLSRAGSNAINEFLYLKKPMLLVPLPKGESRGDQLLNADYFKRQGYCRVLYQEDMTPAALERALEETYLSRAELTEKMAASGAANGATNVVREILKAAKIQ